MPAAGQLATRITIRQQTATQDAWGQPIRAWVVVATVWADVRAISGMESIKSDVEASLTRASARIRWRTDLTPDMRVLLHGQEWHLKAILPDYNRREYVDLSMERVQ